MSAPALTSLMLQADIRQAENRKTQTDNAPWGRILEYLASAESLPDCDVIGDEYLRSQSYSTDSGQAISGLWKGLQTPQRSPIESAK